MVRGRGIYAGGGQGESGWSGGGQGESGGGQWVVSVSIQGVYRLLSETSEGVSSLMME